MRENEIGLKPVRVKVTYLYEKIICKNSNFEFVRFNFA